MINDCRYYNLECNFPYIKDANSESKPLQLDNSCMKNKDCLKFSSGSRTFPPVWPVTAGNEKQGLYAAVIWLPQYGATIQTIVISKPKLKVSRLFQHNCKKKYSGINTILKNI